MTYYANDVHPIPPDHGADDCDDQLPLISRVGRGLKGNSSKIEIHDDEVFENGSWTEAEVSEANTYLEGLTYDEASKTYKTDWISENINGGRLMYQYNLRPYTIPRTFTITFIYRRPGRTDWSWTTPAIPYIWTLDDAGKPEEFPDHIVGSGVATLFIKTVHDAKWNERLNYPNGTTRDDFNAPGPKEAWAATITFGKGGDIEVPDFDDIAKIIGITKSDLFNILEGNSVTINGISAKNLIEYIDKCDARDLDHLHKDLGFDTPFLNPHHTGNAFGVSPITNQSYPNVKDYIDGADMALSDKIDDSVDGLKDDLMDYINNLYGIINDLVNHIFGASLVTPVSATDIPSVSVPKNSGKKINWNKNNWQSGANITYKIPQGNINVLSPDWGKAILTHSDFDGAAGDVKTNA